MKDFATLTELSQALASFGPLAVDGKGTICVDTLRVSTSTASGESLPDVAAELALLRPISRGGMGEIYAARQASLRRSVAVKRPLHDDVPDAARAIVAEARVAGALEHPNIVPVHLLGTDERGRPLLVMKRIEGRTWSNILKTEGRNVARDVEILMDVCRALHFAHSHGVVHRDVKPANVMVGSFGEVYLLDWGIAVAHSDDAPGELPRAKDVAAVAGTPGYMAPEMVFPTGEISPRTDVFLAGATLFDVVTGARPWVGETIEEQLFKALRCRLPELGAEIPEELVDIVRKAMHKDPAQRYASAEEMRAALARFRDHAVVRGLCDEAEARLAVLVRDAEEASTSGARDVERKKIAQVFAECRFGFTQALRAWPESTRAQRGLAAAIEAMARREIGAGHVDSASLLVDELHDLLEGAGACAELRDAVVALEARRATEARSVEELAREKHEHDLREGDAERARTILVIGVLAAVMCIVLEVLHQRGVFDAAGGAIAIDNVANLLLVAALARRWPKLRETEAARVALRTLFVACLTSIVLNATCFALSIAPALVVTLNIVNLGAAFADRATQDTRMWRAAAATWLFVPGFFVWPDHAWLVGGAAALAGFAATAWIGLRNPERAYSESTRSSAR